MTTTAPTVDDPLEVAMNEANAAHSAAYRKLERARRALSHTRSQEAYAAAIVTFRAAEAAERAAHDVAYAAVVAWGTQP